MGDSWDVVDGWVIDSLVQSRISAADVADVAFEVLDVDGVETDDGL